MFAFAFSFAYNSSLIRPIRAIDDGNRQENEDPNFIDVPKGDNDKGKS